MTAMFASRAANDSSALPGGDGPTALQLYEQAAALVSMGAWSCDLGTERLTWTDGVFDLFGISIDAIPQRRAIIGLYDEESRELLEYNRARAIQTRSGFSLDARIVRADGSPRWIRITAATQISNRRAVRLYGVKQDITEDRARWESLRARAECDPLTGLGNRAAFQRFLDLPKDAPAPDHVGALLLLDMDGFKQVNDWWGHAAGDACLFAVGTRLRKAFPHAHLISRIGGDEFAILLSTAGAHEAEVRARLCNLLCPVAWNGNWLPIGLSAGLAAVADNIAFDPQNLFLAADRALYTAKGQAGTILACA